MGLGLTGSIVLRSGRLSELISQLQELLKGVDDVQFSPYKYDHTLLAAQIRQLAQELKDLTMSNPQNMMDAVAAVSKQLDNVSETLNTTKRHLSRRLESLDWKVEEQKETSLLIANNVDEMKSNLSEIGFNVEMIHKMVAGLDVANSGLWYLCQFAEGVKDGGNAKLFQDIDAKLAIEPAVKFEEKSVKGLQFLTETNESAPSQKPTLNSDEINVDSPVKKVPTMKTKVHRSYAVGISWARDIIGPDT
ncbi:Lipid-binding serum glycoprotein family protein isoform 1 [Hibiscus syriacus]|uniref:Lipid-binding serum glycoprotein family protein isoform 1 n=1 Tax=Hibiscus syriacus TaxID=106335 RepID=A0A6A2WMK9_HIBSY|nr:Lipid-binding serum glycoprotein family protein isoform 1 [Hibiscus syriacus]